MKVQQKYYPEGIKAPVLNAEKVESGRVLVIHQAGACDQKVHYSKEEFEFLFTVVEA